MSDARAAEILSAAAAEVLETMFFTDIEGQEEPPEPGGPPLQALVRFRGRPSGIFRLSVSAEAARTLAADFLGLEEKDAVTPAQVEDVVGELANMICGAALSRLENDAGFEILPPEAAPAEGGGDAVSVRRAFNLGTGKLEVSFCFEQDG